MPLRLVLDTNVWLDWLVFDDPETASVKAAVASGQAEVFIDAACEQELVLVLARPLRKEIMDAAAQNACLTECRRIARRLKSVDSDSAGAQSVPHTQGAGEIRESAAREVHERLPVCRDPDDQKFLELARDCRADFLITKDIALLKLARRRIRRVPFRIVTPEQFSDEMRLQLPRS